MKIAKSKTKTALKMCTVDFDVAVSLVRQAFGGHEVYEEPGLCVFELQDGNILEIYGPGSNYPAYLFKRNKLVMSYTVDNLDTSVEEALNSGMNLIFTKQALGTCFNYCHLSDEEGNIFELIQEL